MTKFVYDFDEGSADMVSLLGSKGAHLSEMSHLGLNVPLGFVITTDACKEYFATHKRDDGLWNEIASHISNLEKVTGKKLGDTHNPLVLSVRSGAPVSMPGMMDTILNVGLTPYNVEHFGNAIGNMQAAYEAYCRLLYSYATTVLGLSSKRFDSRKNELGNTNFKKLATSYETYLTGAASPYNIDILNVDTMLRMCVEAVFRSWYSDRAIDYRTRTHIDSSIGTGCVVMSMVFGNLGDDSGTGVVFSRNPNDGSVGLYGEYLPNAQGEDIVGGERTPMDINISPTWLQSELNSIATVLEQHYKEVQDIEFTVERGKLYILQTRTAKRTDYAAIRTAVDMVEEGLITKDVALSRVENVNPLNVIKPTIRNPEKYDVIGVGVPASPGIVTGSAIMVEPGGKIYHKYKDKKYIFVGGHTSPADVPTMLAMGGIVTVVGGATCHAAVVARSFNIPAVVGVEDLEGKYIHHDTITVDGYSGKVYSGVVDDFEYDTTINEYVDKLKVWFAELL